jgi:hypothetical protein
VSTDSDPLVLDRKVTYLEAEKRETVEILRSFLHRSRRRTILNALTKPSRKLGSADMLVQGVMSYSGYDMARDEDFSDHHPELLLAYVAYMRGAAQRALEHHELPSNWLRPLLARSFFLYYELWGWQARKLAYWATIMVMNKETSRYIERGRKEVERLLDTRY